MVQLVHYELLAHAKEIETTKKSNFSIITTSLGMINEEKLSYSRYNYCREVFFCIRKAVGRRR